MFCSQEIERLQAIIQTLIEELPKETLNRFINVYKKFSYNKCPDYIQSMFLRYYNFKVSADEIYYIKENKKGNILVKLGNLKDSLQDIITVYTFDKDYKGKLLLSCPHCQTIFPLICTTSENYVVNCNGCGRRLVLKVKSNEVTIRVNDNKGN